MCGRIGTIGYRIGNHEAEAARTTPEAPDLQRLLRDMVTRGAGAVRDRGVVARAGAAPRRPPPLRRRRLHQPDPRPPRFPSRHGGLLRGQAPAVRAAAGGRVRRRRTWTIRRGAAFAAAAPTAGDLRDRRRRRTSAPEPARALARGAGLRRAHAARRACISARRSSAGRTSTTSLRPRRPRSRSTCRSARSKGASRLSPVFPAVSSSSPIPATTCGSWSTTRTPTMR